MLTHYDTLGISRHATAEEIRLAFRKLAVKYHPDKNLGNRQAEEQFKRVNEAYQVLSDEDQKAAYDLKLSYQQVHQSYQQAQQHRPPPPPPVRRPQPPFYHRARATTRFSPQDERKSIGYAFGFIGLIAILVVAGVAINRMVERRNFEAKTERFDYLMGSMETFCYSGDVDSAVHYVRQMQREGLLPGNKEDAEQMVLGKLYLFAQNSFIDEDYANTVYYGGLVNRRSKNGIIKELNLWMARSHQELGQSQQALARLDELIKQYPSEVQPFMEAARLVRAERPRDAFRYYQGAIKVLTDQYEAKYGKAYMLAMPSSRIPAYHFEIFLEVGRFFYESREYELAEGLLVWANHINEEHEEGYKWLAATYRARGKQMRACNLLRNAVAKKYIPAWSDLLTGC